MSIAVHGNNSQTCYCHANVHIVYHDGAWAVSPGYPLLSLTSILSIPGLKTHNHLHHQVTFPLVSFGLPWVCSAPLLWVILLSICGYRFFFPLSLSCLFLDSSSSLCYTSTIRWLLYRFSWPGSLIDCSDHSLPLIPLECLLWDKACGIYYFFDFCLTSTAVT